MNFWKTSMERYTLDLEENGDIDMLPLTKIAIDNTESLVQTLEMKKNFEDAKIIRLLSLGGVYTHNSRLIEEYNKVDVDEEQHTEEFFGNLKGFKPDKEDILAKIAMEQANKFFNFGK
jgi:hypothetical protein